MKNKIKVLRTVHSLSQANLALMTGVSRQTIHAIENGKFVPSTLLALRIARVFEVPVEEVFQLEEGE